MSGPFGIATVSAVLRRLLTNGLHEVDLSIFGGNATSVTAHPPDQIVVGANESAQLNLFLYRVSPNAALRNEGLAARSAEGERLTNPPLALDLHYLLTAYGTQEFFPEALLGYGMQVLHEVPFLSRQFIRNTWPGGGNDPVEQALAGSEVADQIEYIKVSPQTLTTEELSKLWTAFQAKYRPSAAYLVSVLLIQAKRGARAALPVLTQGRDDSGPVARGNLIPPFPEINALTLPRNQSAATLGDQVQIVGHDFAGDLGDKNAVTLTVRLQHPRFEIVRDIPVPPGSRGENEARFQIPDEPANLPAGVYMLSVIIAPNGQPTGARTSNQAPLLLAPRIPNLPVSVNAGTFTLTVAPEVRPGQSVSLILDSRELPAGPIQAQVADVPFDTSAVDPGTYRARVRVDGVDSLLVDRSDPKKLSFDETQKITIT